MAFQVTGIQTPNFGETLPMEALENLHKTQDANIKENRGALGAMMAMRAKVEDITDPTEKAKAMERLKPYTDQIDNLTNAVNTDPRSFSQMGDQLARVGMGLANEFTRGDVGKTINFFNDLKTRKQHFLDQGGAQSEADDIYSPQNPNIQKQLENMRSSKPYNAPTGITPKEEISAYQLMKEGLPGLMRSQHGEGDYVIQADGKTVKNMTTNIVYDLPDQEYLFKNLVRNNPQWIMQQKNKAQYSSTYNKPFTINSKTGDKEYIDKNGNTTTNEAEAINAGEVDIHNSWKTFAGLQLAGASKTSSIALPPKAGGKAEPVDTLFNATTSSPAGNTPITTPEQLTGAVRSNADEVKAIDAQIRKLDANPNVDPSIRQELVDRRDAKYQDYKNTKTEDDDKSTHAFYSLHPDQRDILKKYQENGNYSSAPKDLLAKVHKMGQSSEVDRQNRKELAKYEKAYADYQNERKRITGQWYPANETSVVASRKGNVLSTGDSVQANEALSRAINIDPKSVIVKDSKGNVIENDAAMTLLNSEKNTKAFKNVSIVPTDKNNHEIKINAFVGGKNVTIELKNDQAKSQFMSHLATGGYDNNTKLIGSMGDPISNRVLTELSKTKPSLDSNKGTGAVRNFTIPSGTNGNFSITTRRANNGTINIVVKDPEGVPHQEIIDKNKYGDQVDLYANNFVQLVRKGYLVEKGVIKADKPQPNADFSTPVSDGE